MIIRIHRRNVKMLLLLWWFIMIGSSAIEGVILDSRCYLEGGGSAESFLTSEDTPVGSVIGTLRINGNPKLDTGDINLTLREKDAPIKIAPGTKNLILVTRLDKEGVEGPSSVYVNVICDRRHSTDPSFVIPVNVRVTDVNDNAPQWIGAPYSVTLSEVTVPGTRILQGARAVDLDQQGPFSTVEYEVMSGPFSEYVQFLNSLDGTLVLKKALDYEMIKNFTVRLRAQDQGRPPKFTDTLLRVIITDADDQNPRFTHEEYYVELPLDGKPGELEVHPGPIKAVDQDEGICAPVQYSIIQSSEAKNFHINPKTGTLSLVSTIAPTDFVNPVTLVIKAMQIDNPDRYALATLRVLSSSRNRNEVNPLSFIKKKFVVHVREDTPVGSRILALPTNKPEKYLRYYIPNHLQAQFFSFGPLGELILEKPLDYEKATKHIFDVIATDGVVNATAQVNIEVIDVNDWEPRFRKPHYQFRIQKHLDHQKHHLTNHSMNSSHLLVGQIEAADGDTNDQIQIKLKGQDSELFEVDAMGNLWMRIDQPVNKSALSLIAIATDSGIPSRSTSIPISITIENSDLIETSWTRSLLAMFGSVTVIFAVIVTTVSCCIIRAKKRSRRTENKVHSKEHGAVSSSNLINHEKISLSGGGGLCLGANIPIRNPMNSHDGGGSGSSLSAGASTILAASLEREARNQRESQKQCDNYTATVRSIVSRASATLDNHNMERDSISNDELPESTEYTNCNNDKSNQASSSLENLGSLENNLTVYF